MAMISLGVSPIFFEFFGYLDIRCWDNCLNTKAPKLSLSSLALDLGPTALYTKPRSFAMLIRWMVFFALK